MFIFLEFEKKKDNQRKGILSILIIMPCSCLIMRDLHTHTHFHSVFMGVLFPCASVHHFLKTKNASDLLELELTNSCESPCEFWELNPVP